MILIKNTQRKIAIDTAAVERNAQQLLELLRYPDYDLGIWITTDKTIARYNKQFRKKNKPTDILSFPYHTKLKAGERIKPKTSEDKNLGDIIISAEYVKRDAARYDMTFEERLRVLLVHGMCHLLGYDHIENADYRKMRAKEIWLLKKLSEID